VFTAVGLNIVDERVELAMYQDGDAEFIAEVPLKNLKFTDQVQKLRALGEEATGKNFSKAVVCLSGLMSETDAVVMLASIDIAVLYVINPETAQFALKEFSLYDETDYNHKEACGAAFFAARAKYERVGKLDPMCGIDKYENNARNVDLKTLKHQLIGFRPITSDVVVMARLVTIEKEEVNEVFGEEVIRKFESLIPAMGMARLAPHICARFSPRLAPHICARFAPTLGMARFAPHICARFAPHICARFAPTLGMVRFAPKLGMVRFAPKLGMVRFAPKLGMVRFAPKLGMVRFAPKLGMVRFAPKLGMVRFAPKLGMVRMAPKLGMVRFAPKLGT